MNWCRELEQNITRAEELKEPLRLAEGEYRHIREEVERFPMSISRYYFSLIDPADPDDPIRRMAVPAGVIRSEEGELDTSGEHSNTVLRGVQHKYAQTLLILVSSDCAMYCRHCFRRRLVGISGEELADDPEAVVAYIGAHPEVTNCLLTGGDALVLPTAEIRRWLTALTPLPQLDFIRIGSRTPVTFPERISGDPELLGALGEASARKQLYLVTHFNHPRELTEAAVRAVREVQGRGVVVKNQTVLLRGVNDDPQVLGELLRGLTRIGVVAHYVFQCRPVKGVKTIYQVPLLEGSRIVSAANAMQNGIGKSADYTMSHVTGKIRILGEMSPGEMLFQYRQAKEAERIGKLFVRRLAPEDAWLEEGLVV